MAPGPAPAGRERLSAWPAMAWNGLSRRVSTCPALLKIAATSRTISSGGSGGVFGPSFFIGAERNRYLETSARRPLRARAAFLTFWRSTPPVSPFASSTLRASS